jgi:hypothetical protein
MRSGNSQRGLFSRVANMSMYKCGHTRYAETCPPFYSQCPPFYSQKGLLGGRYCDPKREKLFGEKVALAPAIPLV